MMTLLPFCALSLVVAGLLSLLLGVLGLYDIRLYNAQDLIDFPESVPADATVFLENDIDFAGLSSQFKPIGDASNPFCGTFDGQGHKISNLVIDSSSFRHTGFFGYSQGTSIRNLVLDDTCSITSSCTTESTISAFVGGIIGCCYAMRKSWISESNVNMAAVSFNGNSGGSVYMGGIVGQLYNEGQNEIIVKNCINYAAVTYAGSNSLYTYVGGIVGEFPLSDSSTTATKLIQNCINYGAITSSGTDGNGNRSYVDGIIGISSKLAIENCVNVGQIEITQGKNTNTGNIVGLVRSDIEINYCPWISGTGYTESIWSKDSATIASKGSYEFTIYAASVSALNSYGSWNRWVYNTNSTPITFHTNRGGYTIASQKLILLPSLAVGVGWTSLGGTLTSPAQANLTRTSSLVLGVLIFMAGGSTLWPSMGMAGVLHGPLPGAVKTGYTFIGWYTNITGGDLIESDTKMTITSDHILYAHWMTNNYTVTFKIDNGTAIEKVFQFNETVEYPKNPEKEGFMFAGWDNNITIVPNHNNTINALWNETTQFVEIVFGIKDMSKEKIEIIIEGYVGTDFTIVEYEN